jgi:hypothetical protein
MRSGERVGLAGGQMLDSSERVPADNTDNDGDGRATH